MKEIAYDAEVTMDWDWFAVDVEGSLGHFATGAYRRLPPTARQDGDVLEELLTYFESVRRVDGFTFQTEFLNTHKFIDKAGRARYLNFFGRMASSGLYSYDGRSDYSRGLSHCRHSGVATSVLGTPISHSGKAGEDESISLLSNIRVYLRG